MGSSFTLKKGEILALAGEREAEKRRWQSGSSPRAPVRGSIRSKVRTLLSWGQTAQAASTLRCKCLPGPFESLNPRMIIKEIIAEPIRGQHMAKGEAEVESGEENAC